ncbi:PIN domain-containing protein [Elstera sp.]|jgi:predicted nucleic acid-binding protein|uniref:PIN domain-containing protein n=1 Tax=Elstera sp. TaxID=1916664 RepID=UPI0037BE4C8B
MPRGFLDTNILVYAFVEDPRAAVAEALLDQKCDTSVQALNEFATVARRKLRMTWGEVEEALALLQTVCGTIHPIELKTHADALRLAQRYGFSSYDALIVAAALRAGCDTLYSEDMQDGLAVDGRLTIRNPFKSA